MELSNVFDENIKAYNAASPLIINQGGTRSGKTYSILQLLFLIAVNSKHKLIISIVSRALPHLRLGAMRDFEAILEDYGINISDVKNETKTLYKIGNSVVEFFGADSQAKVHGPARDILYINECNFIKQKIYEQLAIRTKGTIFLDYNPTSRFWVHDEVIPNENHTLIKSTYKDNNFLTLAQINRIESKQENENWWRVYGLGEIGILEDAIFTNWRYGEFDNSFPFVYGLDFGSNDPDALVKVAINNKLKIIYVDEVFYDNNLTTNTLLSMVGDKVSKDNIIYADSSGRRTIMDMQAVGINVKKVRKYSGSILDGIRLMQDYTIVITSNSYNIEKELMAYRWLDNRAKVPIDADNHAIDALRYAVMSYINPTKRKGVKLL